MSFLKEFIKNYGVINRSSVVSFRIILDQMVKVITSFRVACNYKMEDKKIYYQLLGQIHDIITVLPFSFGPENQKNSSTLSYKGLIEGCQAFTELQTGIFNLNDQGKL